jgi:hypothetical protein
VTVVLGEPGAMRPPGEAGAAERDAYAAAT